MSVGSTPTEDMTAAQALSLGDALALDGDWNEAVDAYAAGLAVLGEVEGGGSTSSLHHFRLLSHRSSAFYHLGRFSEALEDGEGACEAAQTSGGIPGLRGSEREAALLRCGTALYQLGRFEESQRALEQVVQLAELNGRATGASCAGARDWIARCKEELEPPQLEPARPIPLAAVAAAATPIGGAPVGSPPAVSSTSFAASTSPPLAPERVVQPPKYQYYQSDKVMTIAILESWVNPDDVSVAFPDNDGITIRVVLTKQGREFVVVSGHLFAPVDVSQCRTVVKDEKVLVKLKKQKPNEEWYDLLAKKKAKTATATTKNAVAEESSGATPATTAPADAAPPAVTTAPESNSSPPEPATATMTRSGSCGGRGVPRPYASHKDWDKIEKEVAEEEDKEIPEGDAAAMKLFRQIYANASEDTRRAMIKSYQTSGGTVLSTNWDEVSKKDYEKERTAPKGQEWKTWEGEKLE